MENLNEFRVLSLQEMDEAKLMTNLLTFELKGTNVPKIERDINHNEYAISLKSIAEIYSGTMIAPILSKAIELHLLIGQKYPDLIVDKPFEFSVGPCGGCGCHGTGRCYVFHLGGCFMCF